MPKGSARSTRRLLCFCLLAASLTLAAVPAGAAGKSKTFSSGPVDMPIPDAVGTPAFSFEVLNTFKVKKRGKIRDVDAAVRITHPDSTDLVLSLYHRAGAISLADHRPKDGNKLSPDYGAGTPGCEGALFTTFDDEAPFTLDGLDKAPGPFIGPVQPEAHTPLSLLNGLSLQGKWQLGLSDGLTGKAGTLNCWQVTVRYRPEKRK